MSKVDGIDWCDAPVMGFRGWVPCRKCPTCRRLKAWRWLQRCLDETSVSERTWFVTLTFRKVPEDGGVRTPAGIVHLRRSGRCPG